MTTKVKSEATRARQIIEQCVRREMLDGASAPAPHEDLVESGAVDSMAWVSVIRCIEAASGDASFGERMLDRPRSIEAMCAALEEAQVESRVAAESAQAAARDRAAGPVTTVAGWGATVGRRLVAAAALEREFNLPAGKISRSAGIESVARVVDGEDELWLGADAAQAALRAAQAGIGEVECVIATSETHTGYPSLGARLHAHLLADQRTGVLDIGGACLGAVNAFAVAQQFIATGRFRNVLVVSADVHSRVLRPGRVKGEFGALFGDGASAFLLRAAQSSEATQRDYYSLGEVTLGCDPSAASAIRIALDQHNGLDLTFDGEALSRAAVSKLEQLIEDLELRAGIPRDSVAAFATHQPNPRLLTVLAKQLGVPAEKFPPVARTCGNLGSSTCGVALARALDAAGVPKRNGAQRPPIFLASLGPGLLFGSAVLS